MATCVDGELGRRSYKFACADLHSISTGYAPILAAVKSFVGSYLSKLHCEAFVDSQGVRLTSSISYSQGRDLRRPDCALQLRGRWVGIGCAETALLWPEWSHCAKRGDQHRQ